MSHRQPTFAERIRLLENAAAEALAIAEQLRHAPYSTRVREVADLISAEVARMKAAQVRWQERQAKQRA